MLLYELIVLPADHPMTADEAAATISKFASGLQLSIRRDHRLDAFEARMEERWPQLKKHDWERPFEFDAMRHHVFVGIPFEGADEIARSVVEAAWSTGVAVFDPKRHLVGLPSPMSDAPLSVEGIQDLILDTEPEG